MRISDWSSDVCSSDLDDEADSYFAGLRDALGQADVAQPEQVGAYRIIREIGSGGMGTVYLGQRNDGQFKQDVAIKVVRHGVRSEEHTSELQSLMRISYAVFCLKKKKTNKRSRNERK